MLCYFVSSICKLKPKKPKKIVKKPKFLPALLLPGQLSILTAMKSDTEGN